jgi:hypothetical protein
VTAAAWTAAIAVLAGCALYTRTALRGHQPGPGRYGCLRRSITHRAATALLGAAIAILSIGWVRGAVLRARWAWRCRGCPPRNDGHPLDDTETGELITIRRGWKDTARPERTRT